MTKHRLTYADTIHHARVTFEHVLWDSKTGEFEPWFMDETQAIRALEGMPYAGFTSGTKADWPDTRLAWLKPMHGNVAGDPKTVNGSVWEFQTTTPFTD